MTNTYNIFLDIFEVIYPNGPHESFRKNSVLIISTDRSDELMKRMMNCLLKDDRYYCF